MLPTEATHILYHGDCPDGFGAAFAAWQVLGDSASYYPAQHGEHPPDLPSNAKVAIVDFSYKRDVILALRNKVQDMVILDHHVTAQDELTGLDFAVFDMEKSGARMAWEYWHPDTPIPELLVYIEDKDLWLWNQEQSKEVSIALHSYPQDFEVWNELTVEHLKLEGVALLRLQEQLIEQAVARSNFTSLFGYQVPIVNATEFRSEIANRLCSLYPEAPFAAAYHYDKSGEENWSLRSIGDFDVADLARTLGGGGHKNASGFTGTPPQLSPTN